MADRLPAGESIVRGRSHCNSCGRTLGVLDLVPVAGFLARRGRCPACGAHIPARYPLLEAAAGLVMAGAVVAAGPLLGGLAGLVALTVVGSALVALATRRPPG